MAIKIPRELVEYILLGPVNDRRQIQDSPILGDVWLKYAEVGGKAIQLLITPLAKKSASELAMRIYEELEKLPDQRQNEADIAPLQDVVAAQLMFVELLRIVVPLTRWWHKNQKGLKGYLGTDDRTKLDVSVNAIVEIAKNWPTGASRRHTSLVSAIDRYVALVGLILWAGDQPASEGGDDPVRLIEALKGVSTERIKELLAKHFANVPLSPEPARGETGEEGLALHVSLNRHAVQAIERSVVSVKADAATTLFKVNCAGIAWAVVDSGIDATHPAFRGANGETRVKSILDFGLFRRIVSLSNWDPGFRKESVEALKASRADVPFPADPDKSLLELACDARDQRPINWRTVENLVRVNSRQGPRSDHGTHVAGIIGARRVANRVPTKKDPEAPAHEPDTWDGMCPDIELHDFRVLGGDLKDTEFAIIAAMQYIRHLNESSRHTVIHGVNLSLSIDHNVRNYACGRTPVCVECERLVESGIVVVAAAGNRGYQSFQTKDGAYEGYAALSITDPGNADGVITVGATHRNQPHTYGVSYFSSRGPTGDGRPKPDLVAPGERIRAPIPGGSTEGGEWDDLDGTSMAAPHVSGAAAMLMARYPELIGRPRRIKQILCDSATDLGRERSFQGRGMLDVLRALQSI